MNHIKHLFNFLLNRELDGLYLTVAIKSFVYAMIGIFIPLYLSDKGYNLQQILLFFIINFVVFLLLTLVTPRLINKIGLKKTLLISIPSFGLFFLLLNMLNGLLNWIFFIVPIFGGMSYAFFWIPFHSDFAISSSKKSRATQTGTAQIIMSLIACLGPVVGGFLIIKLGFHWLLIVSSVLMFLGIIPLLRTPEFRETKPGTIKDILKFVDFRNALGFFAYGVEWVVYAVVWPLFIILILKGYLLVGILTAIPLIITVFSIAITSRLLDKKGTSKVMKIGSFLLSLNWILRVLITQVWQVFAISVYYGLIDPLTKVGSDVLSYNRARKTKVVESIAGREFAINLGRLTMLSLLVIFPSFTFAFIVVAFTSLFYFIFSMKQNQDVQKIFWLFHKKKK